MPHHAPNWSELVAGWQLGIYDQPIYCGIIAGVVLGYLGVFVVLRRMVFVTAAVSQASGLGVALAFYAQINWGMNVPPVLGAAMLALASTAVFSLPMDRLAVSRESVLGVAYLLAWSLSVMIGDRISQEAHDISSILFGTAVLVRTEDLIALSVVGGAALLWQLVLHRGITFALFDPEGARVQGLPVRLLDLFGWIWVALAVSVATRALGVLPVFAFAVLPAVSALAVFRRLRWVLLAATTLGGCAGGGGYLVAFFLDLPVGACQAGLACAFAVVALLFNALHNPRH
jgi:zinc transport system permease protein